MKETMTLTANGAKPKFNKNEEIKQSYDIRNMKLEHFFGLPSANANRLRGFLM